MSGLKAIINRPRPSWWSLFWRAPSKTLAKSLYHQRPLTVSTPLNNPVKVVCMSDTHNSQPVIPEGDILIHAGDLTQTGTFAELQQTLHWLNRQPHEHIVAIAGNHDMLLDRDYGDSPMVAKERAALDWGRIIYLQDSATTLSLRSGRTIRLYGTSWTRKHGHWAFQFSAHAGPEETNSAASHFSKIPAEIDVLISHMPPRFYLDVDSFGDESLLSSVKRVQPMLHVFGHVHEGYGEDGLTFDCLEEKYEAICRGLSGMQSMLLVLYMALELLKASFNRDKDATIKTMLVNPCAVGGLRDQMRRTPITVEI